MCCCKKILTMRIQTTIIFSYISDDCGLSSEVLDRMPTQKELGRMCKCIGKDYQLFFIELGLEMDTINDIELDLKNDHSKTKMLHMFTKWNKQSGDKGTTRNILEAMKNQDIDIDSVISGHVFD